jgi:peptidoglycan hydrolase CwlO-like protein
MRSKLLIGFVVTATLSHLVLNYAYAFDLQQIPYFRQNEHEINFDVNILPVDPLVPNGTMLPIGGSFLAQTTTPQPTITEGPTATPTPHPQLTEKNNRIEELKRKVSEKQKESRTLEGQVAYFKAQISLTEQRIIDTEERIKKTTKQIEELGGKIDNLDSLLEKQLIELEASMIAQYKYPKASIFSLLLGETTTSSLTTGNTYYEFLRDAQKRTLIQTQQAKLNAEAQKSLREVKQKELESYEAELKDDQLSLANQKKQKDALLIETKNDEATYQRLLDQAQAEYNAINRAVLSAVKNGPVKKGDVIAITGNSGYPGCSSGKHLHFEVRKNGAWVDPKAYVRSGTINDQQRNIIENKGSGSWDWPLQKGIYMTQDFGKTPWSWRYAYSGGIHTGLDMVGIGDETIYAPADGTLYSTTESCGSSSAIKIKYIDHGSSLLSYFLHVR